MTAAEASNKLDWVWVCQTAAVLIQIIETSREKDPMVFEVGAGDVVGNEMFQVQLEGSEWAAWG